jgi:predicted nuclease of predicted toxin-antitoxin system
VLAAAISLYLDENLTPKIAVQLRKRGVDIISVHELGLTGDSDENHLQRATEMKRVLVTADTDFLVMAAEGTSHAGIIFGVQENLSIGDWVNGLELIAAVYTAEEMLNHVEYL